MSRLASFRGSSTPSKFPVPKQLSGTPTTPSRSLESTFHRKLRTLLQELRSLTTTWDEIVLVDGLKAARGLVDTRTELDNALKLLPDGQLPRTRMVSPQLDVMDKRIVELDTAILKLRKLFTRMSNVVDGLDRLLTEAHKTKGWKWVSTEPLWTTWPLEKFVSSISEVLIPYHRSLADHAELVETLRYHSISFDDSRKAIAQWSNQQWLADDGWAARWEDLCAVEIEYWDATN